MIGAFFQVFLLIPGFAGHRQLPVDVRLRGEVYTGNKFGFGVCRLPLHIAAFPEALAYVQKRMTFMKEHNLAMVMYCPESHSPGVAKLLLGNLLSHGQAKNRIQKLWKQNIFQSIGAPVFAINAKHQHNHLVI